MTIPTESPSTLRSAPVTDASIKPARHAGRRLVAPLGWVLAALLVAPATAWAQAGDQAHPCGPLKTGYGPFDYRTATTFQRNLVEGAHFLPHIESLVRGRTPAGESLGSNIDYTLRAFPNHHRALVSMMRYGERRKTPKPPGAEYTIECYFDRAIRLTPDDNVVRMLYATFLAKQARESDAEAQLKVVAESAAENPLTLYNLGLVYFDLKRYDQALEFAHKASALGMPRTELKDKLRAVGKWQEPTQEAPLTSTPAASATAAHSQ
jgi:tetratricopeptide (TPR) repeat protein